MPATVRLGPTFQTEVADTAWWTLPTANDSSIDTGLVAWTQMQKMLDESDYGGQLWTNPVCSTYSLTYTTSTAYSGGVLAPNGDIHFIPYSAARGQKVSATGTVSTYSLVYTNVGGGYSGGVLAANGDIHFVPRSAIVGQKISANGIVSTYSLAYTISSAYVGGVLGRDGTV